MKKLLKIICKKNIQNYKYCSVLEEIDKNKNSKND